MVERLSQFHRPSSRRIKAVSQRKRIALVCAVFALENWWDLVRRTGKTLRLMRDPATQRLQ
jgi:hypothetical protein